MASGRPARVRLTADEVVEEELVCLSLMTSRAFHPIQNTIIIYQSYEAPAISFLAYPGRHAQGVAYRKDKRRVALPRRHEQSRP